MSDVRSVARIITSLCLVAFATTAFGCASSSGSTTDGAEQGAGSVSGEPPSAEEDTPKPLPNGPAVEVGKARADQPRQEDASGGEDASQNAEQGDPAAAFSRKEVKAFMQKGPSYALTLVRVEPERSDGEFQGFKIAEIEPSAARAVSPHLEKGDVITHINGVRMEKPDDYLNAWKLLNEVNQIRIDFLRDGSSEHAVWLIQ